MELQDAASYYLALAERTLLEPLGLPLTDWYGRIEREYAGIAVVLDRSARTARREEAELGLRLAAALVPFWLANGRIDEGRAWLSRLLGRPLLATPTQARAAALDQASRLVFWAAQTPEELTSAIPFAEAGLAIRQALGERGTAHAIGGEFQSLLHVGVLAWYARGGHMTARRLFEQALRLAQDLGNRRAEAYARSQLGQLALDTGDADGALAHLAASLGWLRTFDDRPAVGGVLFGIAGVAAARDEPDLALRLVGAGAAMVEPLGPSAPLARAMLARFLTPAYRRVNAVDQSTRWAEGHALGYEQAMRMATQALAWLAGKDGG